MLADLERRLVDDPALAARVEAAKVELLQAPAVAALVDEAAEALTRALRADLAGERSELAAWLAERLDRARVALVADAALRAEIDAWARARLTELIERHHGRIAEFIENGVRALGPEGAVRLIEEHAGDDLQFIRVNGTVVGGLAGGAIYAIHLMLAGAGALTRGATFGVLHSRIRRTVRRRCHDAPAPVGFFARRSRGGRSPSAARAPPSRDRRKAAAPGPKSGGVLNVAQREDTPQGFAIHETSTVSTTWPAMPCFNNLVLFDPLKQRESVDTVIGELAEKWSWQDNYRNLVFFLRRNVKWHDGQPFTSKDVKFTFDMLREAPDAAGKLRINPRKDWYVNVQNVEAPDPYTVIFHLKRPQPALLLMMASGYTPIYAAHVPPAQYRTACVGTGPYKVKEWRKGEFIEYVKNPDYFVKGRPYLDGIKYIVIKERGTRVAALQAGQVDAAFPGDTSKTTAEQLKKAVPADGVHARRREREREHDHEHQEAALRQPEGADRGEPRHRPARPEPGGAPGRLHHRHLHAVAAVGRVGRSREGPQRDGRLRQARRREGQGQEADGRGRLHARQAREGRDRHPRHRRSTWTWPRSSSTSSSRSASTPR